MSTPQQMNAVSIDRFGGPEVLAYRSHPKPVVATGQVLVKLAYASVSTWDPLMRDGVFAEITGETPSFPMILGTDGAGTIAAVGDGVDRFAEGDQVYVMGAGLYAEYVVVDADVVSRVPNGVSLDQASAMPTGALTSLQGLTDELNVKKGHTVLINGASGDSGHVAVQLAKLLGAKVLAIASGEDGVRAVQELGADVAIDGKTADIGAAARKFAPDGLDGVLAFIGGPSLDAAISAVRAGGHVAYPLGVEPEPAPRAGVHFHHFDLTLDSPATIKGKMARLNDLIMSGPFEVKVAKVFPLEQARAAHEVLKEHRIGKILLQMS